MRILVTGATGFIGRATCRLLLDRGHEVHGFVRSTGSLERGVVGQCGDLHRAEDRLRVLRTSQPEVVVHLAWNAVPGQFWTAPDNVLWAATTLGFAAEAAVEGTSRFVAAGSAAEYAASAERLLESAAVQGGGTLYGSAKAATGSLLLAGATALGLTVAWARIFQPYGPGEPSERLIPYLVDRMCTDQVAVLRGGAQVRDFVHVHDVARAFLTLAEADEAGPFNIGSGVGTSILGVAELVAAKAGRPASAIVEESDPIAPTSVVAECSRLRSLGWRPEISMDEGIGRLLQERRGPDDARGRR